MATLHITEFDRQGQDIDSNKTPVAAWPPVAQQAITVSSTSAQSAVLNAQTTLIRLHTDTTCWIEVGANPTATAAKMRMVADSTEYFSVRPGSIATKIAAITA